MTEGKPSVQSKSIIYCDMDGVLVDFAPAAVDLCTRILDDSIDSETYLRSKTIRKAIRRIRETMGPDWRPDTRQDLDGGPIKKLYPVAIAFAPGKFFSGLKPLPDAMELLWPYINNSNHEVQLLSAPIHTWRGFSPEETATVMTAEDGKKQWAEEFLIPPPSKVIITPARYKQECTKSGEVPNILIDDREKNIREWEAFGGIGILHAMGNSARTIEKLKQAGILLLKVPCSVTLGSVVPPEVDIQQLTEGDNVAWRAAFPYLQPAAFNITRKRLGHCCPQFVDDVVMVAIEKLVSRLPLLASPIGNIVNVRALLSRITDNAAVDFFRKRCVRKTPPGPGGDDGDEPPDESDLEQLMRDWVDARLICEIAFGDLLTEKEQAVFKGIYLEDLKHREIEGKYGVPEKQVGITKGRLLEKIRKKLDELERGMKKKSL